MFDAVSNFTIAMDLASGDLSATTPLVATGGVLVAFTGFLAHDDGRPHARIARAWRQDGLAFTHALLGQYAGVVIDPQSRRAVLFQDTLGLRTIYFSLSGSRLVASSELGNIRPFAADDPDEDYFAHLLCRGRAAATRTPFRSIAKLAGGINVELAGASRRVSPAWVPPPWAPFTGDADRALRDHLDDAVAATSPVLPARIICELSGGLDSSTVVATLAANGARPTALTYVSGAGLLGEDEEHAATLVERLDLAWRRLDFDRHPRYSLPPDRFLGEPGDEAHQAIQRGYRRITEGADVILTGVGGDVILGYGGIHPLHLADDLARGRLIRALQTTRSWSREFDPRRPWTHYFARFGVSAALRYRLGRRLNTTGHGVPAWLSTDIVRRYRAAPREALVRRGGAPSRQHLWDAVMAMGAIEAASGFRAGLAAQTRHPLLHRSLVEFMIGLDWRLRGGAGREETNRDRVLQRRALTDRLPQSILSRATKGSDQPLHEAVIRREAAFFADLLDGSRLVQRGWVDKALWSDQIKRARFGVFDSLPCFDAAITCEMWLRSLETPRAVAPHLQPIGDGRIS